jgi:hypothetical protein
VLLDLNGDGKLRAISEPWAGRVRYVSTKVKESFSLVALLVRPDGFIAWAQEGDRNVPDADQALHQALTRWMDPPAGHPVPSD